MINRPIYIVGYGNVGWAIYELLKHNGFNSVVIVSNHHEGENSLSYQTFYSAEISEDSLVFITVPDSGIPEIAEKLANRSVHLVHCSGATNIDLLNSASAGVWYPVNTFSKNKPVNWSTTFICLESNNKLLKDLLIELTDTLHIKYYELNSEERLNVHLAAVFASNFSMAAIMAAQQLLEKQNLPNNLLNSLVVNGIEKLTGMDAASALTGPAKRNDLITIQKHLRSLSENAELKAIYESITAYILNHFNR